MGILRWIVELNRIDIATEVSMMASMMDMPRIGHLEQLYHIFGYLKIHHNAELVFDPSVCNLDISVFDEHNWSHTPYSPSREGRPPNLPISNGLGFTISSNVDSDHAGDLVNRISRTGFLVYLNSSPVYWYTKKQCGIETSSLGSDFIALKTCCEYIKGLKYKLQMMGILVNGPSLIFGDNQSVLSNATKPDSTLKKKSLSIAYHFVREGTAAGEWLLTYVNTNDNVADILTKPLPGGEKRRLVVKMLLHHIY